MMCSRFRAMCACRFGCIACTNVRRLLMEAPQSKALIVRSSALYPADVSLSNSSCSGDVTLESPLCRFCVRATSGTFSHQIIGT